MQQEIELKTQDLKPLENLYQQLIQLSIQENYKTKQIGIDHSKMYYNAEIPFQNDRKLNIRYVKLPTFARENKQYYYTIFLNNITYWRAGEKKQLYGQIIETLDRYNVDSYTIFQFGKYHGHIDHIINDLMKYYHIYVFNKWQPEKKDITTIYTFIINFLQKRIDSMNKDGLIFGTIQNDVARLQDFVDFLNPLLSFNVISNYNVKSTFNTSYNNKNRRDRGMD